MHCRSLDPGDGGEKGAWAADAEKSKMVGKVEVVELRHN